MKEFMLLHYGFEPPSPDLMAAWGRWFESVEDRTVEHGGLGVGKEISRDGTRDLPLGLESITGYSIIRAASLEEAEGIARQNPFVTGIRV